MRSMMTPSAITWQMNSGIMAHPPSTYQPSRPYSYHALAGGGAAWVVAWARRSKVRSMLIKVFPPLPRTRGRGDKSLARRRGAGGFAAAAAAAVDLLVDHVE